MNFVVAVDIEEAKFFGHALAGSAGIGFQFSNQAAEFDVVIFM
jgi:hypothetical protein